MRRLLLTMCAAVSIASTASADTLAGYDRLAVKAPHRAGLIEASVWYPVGIKTYRGLIGDGPVFHGTPAYVGAAIAEGRYPMVLLSHGSGGNMDGLSWLSSALAARGAMVLGVNHQGSMIGDSSPRRSILLHERTDDLSAALDALLQDPNFAPHVDQDRITTLGFSLGGTTVLNLAGARMDRDTYRAYCEGPGKDATDCVFLAKGGVKLDALPASIEGDLRDPRKRATIAVDPGPIAGLVKLSSIAAIDRPVLLINLGGEERWRAVDVTTRGSGLKDRLQLVEYVVVEPANHFTFLGLCKPEGPALLEAEQDDPICDDPESADRKKVHAEIIGHVAAFLGL
ncbi:MAG: alpha/beta hydrolase family protein [Geminicoccaceae bacterium]